MDDVNNLPTEEQGILELIDAAAIMQSRRSLDDLERLIDLGDQVAARELTRLAARAEIENIPLPETP